MQQITVTKAKELFLEGEALFVAQEQCRIYYDFFSGESDAEYYLSHGCLVARCVEPVIWHIHALSPASDILSAYQEVVAARKPAERIFAFVWEKFRRIGKTAQHPTGFRAHGFPMRTRPFGR